MDLADMFLARSRHYLAFEYRTKLRAAVESLPSDALWWRPNAESNSVGNLLLHLQGNVTQWLIGGVGQEATVRDRAAEFAATSGADAEQLLASMDETLDAVDRVLARLGPGDL